MDTLTFYLRPDTFPVNATLTENVRVASSSFLICTCLYLASTVLAQFSSTYRHGLNAKERVFWHVTAIRALFGLWAIREGIHGLQSEELAADVALAVTPRSCFLFVVAMGFFFFEGLTVTVADLTHGRVQLLLNLHHWMAFLGYFVGWYYQRFHFFASIALFLEASTPFSALCWTLIKCGQSKTMLWRVNQMIMIHAFHFRSMMECYMWYLSYKHWDVISREVNTAPFWTMYTQLSIVCFVMTPYWTYKKTLQYFTGDDWNFKAAAAVGNGVHNNGDSCFSVNHAPVKID